MFVSASNSETQGLTYLEALASGLPLLCRRDGCLKGILEDGRNGWQYQDLQEFDQRLRWFMDHPESRGKLRSEALKVSGKFSAAAFAECVEKIYRERIHSHPYTVQEMMT